MRTVKESVIVSLVSFRRFVSKSLVFAIRIRVSLVRWFVRESIGIVEPRKSLIIAFDNR